MQLLAHAGLADWPFTSLDAKAYGFVMADPAWSFSLWSKRGQEKSADMHYDCMPLDAIKALPVLDLAAEDCVLWLWATAPMLPLQIEVLEAWGFSFKTSGTWVKTTRTGKIAFGTGYILRNAHEPFLIGTRGDPRVAAKNIRSVLMAPAREHSRKPDEAYDMAERMVKNVRRADLFSRQSRSGWESWGAEAGLFDSGAPQRRQMPQQRQEGMF